VLALVVALLPVLAFLLLLLLFDSFKLVPRAMIVSSLALGALAAMAALVLHVWLFDVTGLSTRAFARTVAPFTEEALKALCILYPLRRRQLGFLVDAGIVGFGIGAGFALVENVEYLRALPNAQLLVWIARGFGAAIMHASTAAIMAVAAKALADRLPRAGLFVVVPGWILAVGLHATYNRALVSPLLAAAVLLFVVPLAVLAVFDRSERLTREWIGDGLDLDVELLALMRSPHFGDTRLGRYLAELRSRFPGPVVADMFCLLQVELELSIRAKGILMAREAGLNPPIDDQVLATLDERAYLQKAIGSTGLLALRPLHVTSHRDDWHRHLLRHARVTKAPRA
jgi:RsiW-degrading membrane proteinase PrsW (M82 family)